MIYNTIDFSQVPVKTKTEISRIKKTENLEKIRTKNLRKLSLEEILNMPIKVYLKNDLYYVLDGNHRLHVLKRHFRYTGMVNILVYK